MAGKKFDGEIWVVVIFAAAVLVSLVWTLFTGQLWHWPPVLGSGLVGVLVVKAVRGEG